MQWRAAHEGPILDFPRCGACGRQWLGDHEQSLQERPSHMVRSDSRYQAPLKTGYGSNVGGPALGFA